VQQQEALVKRICNSVERLTGLIEEINQGLDHAEEHHAAIDKAHAVWQSYEKKIGLVLDTGMKKPATNTVTSA